MNVLVVAALAACGGPDTRATAPPTAVEAPSDTRGDTSGGTPDHAGADHTRPAQARATLPLALATLVPRNGIFAASARRRRTVTTGPARGGAQLSACCIMMSTRRSCA